LNPQIRSLNFYFNDANASYNAFLAELEHRFSRSFQIDVQYRWSHTIDDGSNDYFIGEYPYGNQYRKGNADFDVRHNIKLWGVWSPRFGKSNGWVNKIVGGWQITGITNWHTGYPWTPIFGSGLTGCNVVYTNSGYCNLRPAAYLGGNGMDYSNSAFESGATPTASSLFNNNFSKGALAYFTVPTFSSTGAPPPPSVGRNVLRGPGYFDSDFTLQKAFGLPKIKFLGENARFEFRADFYNLFNRLNLALPDNTVSFDGKTPNPHFGQSQSAFAGRIIQMQARFSF
jgi:hypothetical protein